MTAHTVIGLLPLALLIAFVIGRASVPLRAGRSTSGRPPAPPPAPPGTTPPSRPTR